MKQGGGRKKEKMLLISWLVAKIWLLWNDISEEQGCGFCGPRAARKHALVMGHGILCWLRCYNMAYDHLSLHLLYF